MRLPLQILVLITPISKWDFGNDLLQYKQLTVTCIFLFGAVLLFFLGLVKVKWSILLDVTTMKMIVKNDFDRWMLTPAKSGKDLVVTRSKCVKVKYLYNLYYPEILVT